MIENRYFSSAFVAHCTRVERLRKRNRLQAQAASKPDSRKLSDKPVDLIPHVPAWKVKRDQYLSR